MEDQYKTFMERMERLTKKKLTNTSRNSEIIMDKTPFFVQQYNKWLMQMKKQDLISKLLKQKCLIMEKFKLSCKTNPLTLLITLMWAAM